MLNHQHRVRLLAQEWNMPRRSPSSPNWPERLANVTRPSALATTLTTMYGRSGGQAAEFHHLCLGTPPNLAFAGMQ